MDTWQKVDILENKNSGLIKKIDDTVSSWGKAYGLCSSCHFLKKRKTKLLHEEYWCSYYIDGRGYMPYTQPDKADPIIECSNYQERGRMSLDDMYVMATLIDIKRPIGFSKDAEIIISKPEAEKDNG